MSKARPPKKPTPKSPQKPRKPRAVFSNALADEICLRVANGENLRQICRDKNIAWHAVYAWLHRMPEFAKAYQAAREVGEECIAAECLEIADDGRNDFMKRELAEGVEAEVFNAEHVQRSKLRIETRLKLLAKWNPKKWGDRITHAGDANSPVQLVLNGSDVHG